jgi:radical SAM protein with 4Fe4S-binding SPASM domain
MTTLALDRADIYPSANETVELHRTADGGYLVIADGGNIEIEEYFIREKFAADMGPLFGPMLGARALRSAVQAGLCELAESPSLTSRGIRRITGSNETYQQLHATFEIIETCNFTCAHCYYSSSPLKRGRISFEQAVEVMDTLAKRGVRVIELTGGECTVHPDFVPILRHATKTFSLVAVISNGYLLGTRPELLREVASHSNVMVQISIDGLETTHDMWRKHKGSFRAATAAARELSRLGTLVRMASVISEANAHEVVDLFHLAVSMNVAAVAFSPVAALGRGCNVSEPGVGAKAIVDKINRSLAQFAGHPLLARPPDSHGSPVMNCGAGSRTYAIDYDGNVRACNFSRDSKRFGNVFSDSYETIFGQTANHLFRNAPSPGGAECEGCNYYHYCQGCFVKAFMVSEREYPDCPWRKRWFPGMALQQDEQRMPLRRDLLPSLVERATPKINYCGCQSSSCRSNRVPDQ